MIKEDILIKLENIKSKIDKLKDKTKQEEFDMYEFMKCWCEFGESLSLLRAYYDKNGWPEIAEIPANHYKIWELEEISKSCRLGLSNIEVNSELAEYDFLDNRVASDLFFEVCTYASIGEYDIPVDQSTAAMKKETLCKSMSVLFNIWNEKRKNPDYQYNNTPEWNYILDTYQLYKEKVGIQSSFYTWENEDLRLFYEGPQFGKSLEEVQKLITMEHMYREEPKKLEKKS